MNEGSRVKDSTTAAMSSSDGRSSSASLTNQNVLTEVRAHPFCRLASSPGRISASAAASSPRRA
jgi:hypothetical protein